MRITFNMNDYVRIKLTDHGKEVYRKYWADRLPTHPPPQPHYDSEGWITMQLWVVMQYFGAAMGNGLPVPFDTEMELVGQHSPWRLTI